ncbi:MAG TPA: acetate--CoA ligase family protein [Xanthobacteraceae bacterium]|nr:acetate--CoA ligase family protein [Xanthobacteraceae bacterium]
MPDIAKMLWPRAVAVVGASNDTHGLRGRVLQVMRGHAFEGRIYPVSRSEAVVQGLKAYPSVADLPERVDLAVLIIPARFVPGELEKCGQAGVRAAAILASGFAEERSEAGADMQAEIRAIAQRYDMAVAGPNAEGFANLAARLCPTFSPAVEGDGRPLMPPGAEGRGQIAVIAQSGGMGFAFFDRGRDKGLPFRYVVTTGNEACLETFDFVDHMLDEGRTDVFLLLLEDIKSAVTFRRVAERALRLGKPLIVGKIGQSEAGSRAVASHTAALAGSPAAYRAVFARYGVIEGRDLDEMLDLAAAFLAFRDRLPSGRRVGIVTASGGGGGWLADACAAAELEVPPLDAETRAKINVHLPSYGTSQNPVDVTAQAVFKVGYTEFARLVAGSPNIDGVMVVSSTRRPRAIEAEREKLIAFGQETKKPLFFWSYTIPAAQSVAIFSEAGVPLLTNMHNCARAMRALADYAAARTRPPFDIAKSAVDASARDAVAAALAKARGVLCEWEARPLLLRYGVAGGETGALARSADEAEAAARKFGRPVALKVQSPDIPHKTEAEAVALHVANPQDVRAAFARVLNGAAQHAPGARILGVLVQPMAPPGREMILGVHRDPTFGPLLMVGLGGVLVEALGDVALAPVPLSHAQARALLASLKGAALLDRHRGAPAADVEALVELMARLSLFAADQADAVAAIDLNPVIVHEQGQGVSIVDALLVKPDAP